MVMGIFKFLLKGYKIIMLIRKILTQNKLPKVGSFYHLCVNFFPQFSFDSEMYTESIGVSKQLLIMYTFLNQMRIGKNIQHKDDKMNSLYYIFNLFLNRRSAEPSKRNKICFLRSIFYHKNHLNLSEKVIHIKNQFMSILFATYSVLANLHFQN